MKKLIIMISLLTANAYADLNGKWIGQGEWTFEGSGTHCFMDMSFEENEKELIRKPGSLDCDYVGLDILEETFTKDGTNLKNDRGEIVGSYVNNVINLKESYSESVDIFTTIKVDQLHFDYQEKWITKDGIDVYKIIGRLFTNRN